MPSEKPEKDPGEALKRLLTQRLIEEQAPQPKYVLFVDMLGFGALTEAHPNPVEWDFEAEEITSTTSQSASLLGRFQYVLNTVPADCTDGTSPTHLMLFSDCAFMVYETGLSAARSATQLMGRFYHQGVPVRMGLAFGTWHGQRFSFDSRSDITITRAVFYGTGVVRAHNAEKRGGKGFRIFLHPSLPEADRATFKDDPPFLPTSEQAPEGAYELNYLHLHDGLNNPATNKDKLFQDRFFNMRGQLKTPVSQEVAQHYNDTFDALNRMRKQLGRHEFPPPILPIT